MSREDSIPETERPPAAPRDGATRLADAAFATRGGRLALLATFAVLALALYRPALQGPFFSDDLFFLPGNPYLQEWSGVTLEAWLDPDGELARATANYAPVHLALHALEWQLFGPDPTGYHVVNVLLHALASTLLALLLRRALPPLPALAGAAAFLVHPANVEAVAWVFQLKTSASLALACGALLVHPRRPLAGAGLFVLALLTKASAAFALPVAVLLEVSRRARDPLRRRRWIVLGGWSLALGVFAVLELPAYGHSNLGLAVPDPWVRARTVCALALRYLVMAATTWGVEPFQEPAPPVSPLEPWWLASLPVLAALGARALLALRRRREEAAWWAWAVAAFLPISQIFPFPFPMADRYLYFILPGLLGAVLLAGREGLASLRRRRGGGRLAWILPLLALAWLGGLAARTASQTRLWRHPALLEAEAIQRYPEGTLALHAAAREAAGRGDVEGTVEALQRLLARGHHRFEDFVHQPAYARVDGDPRFQAVVSEMARWWVRNRERLEQASFVQRRSLARAYVVLGDDARAAEILEETLGRAPLFDPALEAELDAVRGRLRAGRERPPPERRIPRRSP